MKQKLIHFVLSQYFIALAISSTIIFFLPNYFLKFEVVLEEQNILKDIEGYLYLTNLINNEPSFKLISGIKGVNDASFILYDDKEDLVDQFNYSKKLLNSFDHNKYSFFDTDNNGFKEIYFVTQKADSVFLNIVEPFEQNHNINKEIFIDTIKEFNNRFDAAYNTFKISNYTVDGVKEVFFTLTTGFAGYPRNAYKYNYRNNNIIKSPHLTNVSFIKALNDINDDGFDEVMFYNISYGNNLDTIYTKHSDYSLWLNVLDHNLKFLFKPLEFKVPFSELHALPFKSNGTFKILYLLNSQQKKTLKSKLFIFSNLGVLIKERELPLGLCDIYLNSKKTGFILFDKTTGQLKKMDFELNNVLSFSLNKNSDIYPLDLDKDGINEWLNVTYNKNKFIIYNENFKDKVSFKIPKNENTKFLFGTKKTKNGNQLYIQKGDFYYLFKYDKNKYYYFEYLIYLAIFLAVLGLIFLIAKGQNIRIEKKLAIEKQIAELQIKTIKNQIDPHFVFNAINTISGLMLKDNKLEADDFICKFSGLMRTTLQNSDSIVCTLKDEIEYVEKYISLQQVRFNQWFKYQLDIDKKVNLQEIIPKHIIYSYVENAIKHGLNTKENGSLKIGVEIKENKLILVIEDNGGGFDDSKKTKQNSTGNGMKIMEKIYALYFKLYKKKIKHTIKEITNDKNAITGVKVTIIITR